MKVVILRFVLALVAFVACSSGLQAQTLWHNTQIGMTTDQVAKIVPDASFVNLARLKGAKYSELFSLSGILIGDYPYKASFLFDEKRKLRQVVIEQDGSISDFDPKTIMPVSDALLKSLRLQYGKENVVNTFDRDSVISRETVWERNGTRVSMRLVSLLGFAARAWVSVFYERLQGFSSGS